LLIRHPKFTASLSPNVLYIYVKHCLTNQMTSEFDYRSFRTFRLSINPYSKDLLQNQFLKIKEDTKFGQFLLQFSSKSIPPPPSPTYKPNEVHKSTNVPVYMGTKLALTLG
jgi:hypothetical protein